MQSAKSVHVHAARSLNVAYVRVLASMLQSSRPDVLRALPADLLRCLDQQDTQARCSLKAWHTLMDEAERLTGNRDLVPDLAAQFKPWHAGLMGFTLMTSGTVGELASLLKHFHYLLNDVFVISHGMVDERFYLRLRPATAEHSHRLARLSLTVWAQRLRWLTGRTDLQLDASFEGPPPPDVTPYKRIFGGNVRFEQGENTMWGELACREMPIVSGDRASHQLLHGEAVKQLEILSRSEDRFIDKVRAMLSARLGTGRANLEDLAAELKLPPRTLQRRLEEAGSNFRLVLDDVRRARAEHFLCDTDMPLAELASALGFADHASFNRAFKRWMGCSPGVYRRTHRHPLFRRAAGHPVMNPQAV